MEINEIISVNITDTNENGVGVAKHGGVVVFVPSLVKGDIADIRITELKKNYAIGETVKILSLSDERITPVCPSAEICGGCSLAHVNYEYENLIKKNTVRAALRRAGLNYDTVTDTVSSPERVGYRNKITVHYDKVKKQLGLYSEETNDTVRFDGCMLCSDTANGIINLLNDNAPLLSASFVSEVTIKCSDKSDMLVIVKAECDISEIKRIVESAFHSVDVIPSIDAGKKHVRGSYCGLDVCFSALGFRQVNDSAFSRLLEIVSDIIRKCDFSSCADLYCGSGVIGLTLASSYPDKRFYGIEINEDSIKDAKYNAEKNGLDNIEFFAGDAAAFRKHISEDDLPSLVIVDPPRAGLSPKMRSELISLSPEKIVYVSCNPQTMARDAKELGGAGYEIKTVTPVNMFPMTKHVETVVLLSNTYKLK